MSRLVLFASLLIAAMVSPVAADKLPRTLVVSFDRCVDSYLEAEVSRNQNFTVDYECKQNKTGYLCAPNTSGSSIGDLTPHKLTLTATGTASGVDLVDSRNAVSVRVELQDGGGSASMAELISTGDKHGSRFCTGVAATSTRKLAAMRKRAAAASWTGIAECDRLIQTYVSCDKLPQSARDAFLQNADAWKAALEAGGDAARVQLAESCKQADEAARQSLSALGC